MCSGSVRYKRDHNVRATNNSINSYSVKIVEIKIICLCLTCNALTILNVRFVSCHNLEHYKSLSFKDSGSNYTSQTIPIILVIKSTHFILEFKFDDTICMVADLRHNVLGEK